MVVLEGARSIYSSNVRFGSKADIRSANTDVRYGPIAEVFWEGDDEVLNSRGGTVRDHRRLDATSERNLRKEPSIRLIATLVPGAWSERVAKPIEATLNEMDKAGVTCGMLCAWWGPSGVMISNDEVAQHCRAYPGRFIGIASVDLYRPMDSVRELRKRVKQDGFKGLRIVPWLWGLPPDDRRCYPLFAECCELILYTSRPLEAAQGIRAGTAYTLSGSRRFGVS